MKAQIIDACVISNLTMTLEPSVAFSNFDPGGKVLPENEENWVEVYGPLPKNGLPTLRPTSVIFPKTAYPLQDQALLHL